MFKIQNNVLYKYETDLVDLEIPEGVQAIVKSAFKSHNEIRSIVIPETVTEIGKEAFCECESLQEVTIRGNNLERIGDAAFYWCRKLEKINIDPSVKLGHEVFYGCERLADKESGLVIFNGICFYHDSKQRIVTVPPTVYMIDNSAFAFGAVEKVILNENIKILGESAFERSDLKYINLAEAESLLFIGEDCFRNCEIYDLHVPKSVTVGKNAFKIDDYIDW